MRVTWRAHTVLDMWACGCRVWLGVCHGLWAAWVVGRGGGYLWAAWWRGVVMVVEVVVTCGRRGGVA